jgi:N-acetylneuraminic acid mutarotase
MRNRELRANLKGSAMKRAAAFALLTLLVPLATCSEVAAPEKRPAFGIAVIGTNTASIASNWTSVAPMPSVRYAGMAATGADGRIFVFFGFNSAFNNTAVVYDPNTNAWTSIFNNGGQPLYLAAVAAGNDGRIYLAGGYGTGGPMAQTTFYDPTTGLYSATGFMTVARGGATAAVLANGKILVAGGYTSNSPGSVTLSAELYDPSTGMWTATGSMAQRRTSTAAARAPNGKVFIFGGSDGGSLLNSVEVYDPIVGAWQPRHPMLTARLGHAAVTGQDGLIYVFGGQDSRGPASSVDVYDPVNDSWVAGPAMSSARRDLMSAVGLDGRIYAIGGFATNPQNSVEVLPTAPLTTNVTLTSSANPSVKGQSVSFVVNVRGSNGLLPNDGESVKFLDNGVPFAIAEINQGTATLTLSNLSVGTHTLVANYDGSSKLPLASSNALVQTVTKISTVTTFNATPTPSPVGAEVIYSAQVAAVAPGSGTPDGTYTLSLDGVPYITIPVGIQGPHSPSLSVGQHTFTATYNGSDNYAPSSVTRTHLVTQAIPSVVLTSSANPSEFGQNAQLTITVGCTGCPVPTDGEPLIISDEDGTYIGSASLIGGVAHISLRDVSAGTHVITADYMGTSSLTAKTSNPLTQVVSKAASSAAFEQHTQSPSVYGQGVAYSVTVRRVNPGTGTPIGSATFTLDGAVYAAGVPLDLNGRADAPTLNGLAIGNHTIAAAYSGDVNFASTSVQATHTVNPPPNSAPIANAGGPYYGNEGSTISFSAAGSSDPDNDALTYDWNFGDGSSAVNAGASPGHKYVDNGGYTVSVTVSDGHGHSSNASANVSVANVAPTVSAIAGAQIFAGDNYSASGTFADVGADAFSATVSYGDGSSSALTLNGNAFSLSHSYAAAGTYAVTVTISDDDGASQSSTATVTVLSPAGATQVLGGTVETLVTSGAITGSTASQLTTSLNAVTNSLASGNTTAAGGQIGSFINKVQAGMQSGKISASDGAALIAFAQKVLGSL